MSFEVLLCPGAASISIGESIKIQLGSSLVDVCGLLGLCNEGAPPPDDAMCYESSASRVLHSGLERVLVSPTVGVVSFCSGRAPGKGFEALLSNQAQLDPSDCPSRYMGITLLLPMWQTELCFLGDAGGKGALILQAIYVADEVEAGIPMTANYHSRKTRFENTNEQITKTSLEIKYGARNVTQARGSLVVVATHPMHTMRSIVKKPGLPSSLVCMSLPSYLNSILSSAQTPNDLDYSNAVLSTVSKRLQNAATSASTSAPTALYRANISNEDILVIPGVGITFCQSGVEVRLKESTIQRCLELLGEPSTTVMGGCERKCGPWVDAQDGTRGVALRSHDLDSSNPIVLVFLGLGLELTFTGCHRVLDRITLRNPIPSASRESLSSNEPYQIWKCTNGLGDAVGYDVRHKRPYFTVLLDVDLLTYFQVFNSERRAIVASNWTTWSEVESRFTHASQLEGVSRSDQQILNGMLKDLMTPRDDEVILDGVVFSLVPGNTAPPSGAVIAEGTWETYFQGEDKRFICAVSIFASTTNSFVQISHDLATEGEPSISASQVGLNKIRELIQLPPRPVSYTSPDVEPEEVVEEEQEMQQYEAATEVVSESDRVSKADDEVSSKPMKSTASSEHNSPTPSSKKGKKKNKKHKNNQPQNNSCSNSVVKSCSPSVSVPPSVCDEDETVKEVVPAHHTSSSDIEQHQEVVDSHEMDRDATPATDQNDKDEEQSVEEDCEEEYDANACEHDVTREYYDGDQYPYTEAAVHGKQVEDEEAHLEQEVPDHCDSGTDKAATNTKNEVSFTPSPSDDGGDSVPYLLSGMGMRQDSSVEIQSGGKGAIAQHPPTPEDDRTSDRMSPDSNRYMTCATEEPQTPPETNTPEFMSRYDAGDSLGSNQGSTSLIGRGMRPVSEVTGLVDVIYEDEESGGGAAQTSSPLPSLVPPSQSPGDDDETSNGDDEEATKAPQSTSSAAMKTSATSSPPLSSQNTTASKRSKKKKRGGRK